ncbi:hypothetical protein, partial [Marisediminicola senii]|uniref:hypothetical protein n=1 Tax=Marisediminicola senii TaxID=2711233 RepID=UPI0013E9B971
GAGAEPAPRPGADRHLAWVQSLDGARGLLPRASEAPAGLWRRFVAGPATPSIDIVDGHLLGARQHRATLVSVEQAIDRLAAAMAAIG